MASDDSGQKRGAPPYAPYPTFKSFLGSFKEHVIPNTIDRSLLKGTSGTIQNQVMSTFKFFDLIDGASKPTDNLRELVDSYGSDNWSSALAAMLRRSYPEIFEITLETASAREFSDTFREAYQAEGETYRKASTFFLKAAREAGIALSPYLTSGTKPGNSTGGRKRQRQIKAKVPPSNENQPDAEKPSRQGDQSPARQTDMASQLLAKFPEFDPNWPPDIQAMWFVGYQKLLAMGKK